ncbi:lysoplasmalogenase [Neolewinella persica]|uniref:lysoplasmalogenase n=1 Tax=Neolewinella persica TaxID=70998 RepID=UPI00035E2C7F|nr:lysoplasmalogenase [Neolewinella persica]
MQATTKTLNFLIVISAIIAIVLDVTGNVTLYRSLKPLTTVLIILLPMIFGRMAPKAYWLLTVSGLLLCLIGDIFLLDSENFVFGLAAFLVAHVLFTISFVTLDKFKLYLTPLLLLLAFGLSYYYFLYPELESLALPVFLYFLFIFVMCWQGVCLYLWKKTSAHRMIAVGVVLFLLSDSILALNKFIAPFDWSGVLVLSTYWAAVALIANAVVVISNGARE